MRDIKLPLIMQRMLVDTITLKHKGGTDDWNNILDDKTYQVTNVRCDPTSGYSRSMQGETVNFSSVYYVYPDYSLFDGKLNQSLDLSTMDSDNSWSIIINNVPRTIVNVQTVKQVHSNRVFCYEIEVS
ncbi:putative minor capsid protein [Pediococcus ethanolidurans]|uniref:Minor capsid protein n=2 Tax=Pediococcus ethanolidurans TaxID=319653 RepID=A0A1H9M242_9LACO|nr:putative minor capsid protein [Pediococcus ethanolidurans]GEN94691.1 hypothetical protein PET01_07410 [Pediococcus ethanolidurans]SER17684.1 Minor capsid protein [Pediococcus ethanolidurans]